MATTYAPVTPYLKDNTISPRKGINVEVKLSAPLSGNILKAKNIPSVNTNTRIIGTATPTEVSPEREIVTLATADATIASTTSPRDSIAHCVYNETLYTLVVKSSSTRNRSPCGAANADMSMATTNNAATPVATRAEAAFFPFHRAFREQPVKNSVLCTPLLLPGKNQTVTTIAVITTHTAPIKKYTCIQQAAPSALLSL